MARQQLSTADIQVRLDELLWYHTIDVVPGATTRGWWDLRHSLDIVPFPDVRGKRCLDIGTWDGFYAYEMERRGAAEVVAIDVADLSQLDYPPEFRRAPGQAPGDAESQPRRAGFELLHEILNSSVTWRDINIYDLDPAVIGQFDVVVIGSLLVHLRDPVRALDAVRRVTRGQMLSMDYVHPRLNLLSRRRPLFELRATGADFQWWMASDAGLRHMLWVSGFEILESSPAYLLRPGPWAGNREINHNTRRELGRRVLSWVFSGDATAGGHLHRAHLTRPRF
ncbi:MAG TPA: methyltransferase domain-containing protein [Candidatus Dormibacteraeota bacterium]|jgi:tRNA (mo5U34)-methyltransferase